MIRLPALKIIEKLNCFFQQLTHLNGYVINLHSPVSPFWFRKSRTVLWNLKPLNDASRLSHILFLLALTNSSTKLSKPYFSSFADRRYRHWKTHFISLPNFHFHGGMRKKAAFLTPLRQYAHFSPLPALWFNKHRACAWLTVAFRLAPLSVMSSWMVSQLKGVALLLCCDNIRLMLKW